jgi:hypothetical protein
MMALLAMLFVQLKATPLFWVYVAVLLVLLVLLYSRRKSRKAKH